METKNIDNNRIMNNHERFVVTTREYAAATLDITNHFTQLERLYGNITWGVWCEARNSGDDHSHWNTLHVFLQVEGEHDDTYRQINIYSYSDNSDGYELCRKVEDFIDGFVTEFQDKLKAK